MNDVRRHIHLCEKDKLFIPKCEKYVTVLFFSLNALAAEK
jgi:hypothetical protein